jgi:hypothetical protein
MSDGLESEPGGIGRPTPGGQKTEVQTSGFGLLPQKLNFKLFRCTITQMTTGEPTSAVTALMGKVS